ncbi:MAG: acyl-CoA dehydrogenase family protein [Candidatus Neomarinimicrobiota bacterium]|nr:acyl-CoA dehydrogenase family protein [Candidatus Neomarinimicrobiota bacterium]
MKETVASRKTGGRFMLETVASSSIFTREKFSEEQKEIEMMVIDFCKGKVFPHRERMEGKDLDFARTLLKEMGELGLLSLDIPERLGGMEMNKVTGVMVAEALSSAGSAAFTVTASTQTGIGMLPIVWFGSEAQQEKYLPKLATAEWVGAYALTEPSSGSDATSAKTVAKLSDDGSHYILNGAKQFITNGGIADVYTLFAQVEEERFSAFIVERDMDGFEVGPEEHKMGSKGSSTTPLKLTNVRVPVENLLGNVGDGATIAFNVLNQGRMKLGAHVLGGCKLVINSAVEYALERRQFGQPIAFFDAIKKKFAEMTIHTYALDSLIYRAIAEIEEAVSELDKTAPDYYLKMGQTMELFAIESSISKVMGSETMGFCADEGVQILGGYGFIEEYPMAQIYRDCRIDRIWEGTNEINRQIITGYFMKKALMSEIPIRERIAEQNTFLKSNEEISPHSPLSRQMVMVEAAKQLVLTVFNEALNEFGQDLKNEQMLGEALADSLINIYAIDSTIARVNQQLASNGQSTVLVQLAQALTAESSLKILNRSLLSLNDIYRGQVPTDVLKMYLDFQHRMLPRADVSQLKREIAEYVYSRKKYPF